MNHLLNRLSTSRASASSSSAAAPGADDDQDLAQRKLSSSISRAFNRFSLRNAAAAASAAASSPLSKPASFSTRQNDAQSPPSHPAASSFATEAEDAMTLRMRRQSTDEVGNRYPSSSSPTRAMSSLSNGAGFFATSENTNAYSPTKRASSVLTSPRRILGSLTTNSNTSSTGAIRHSSPTPPSATLTIGENDFSKLGTTVRQIMDDEVLGRRFRAFAQARLCREGIDFLDELALLGNAAELVPTCERLMQTYFADNALRAVNLSDAVRQDLFERFAAHEFVSVYDLFEDAMYEVFDDLKQSDLVRQFCREDEGAKAFVDESSVLILSAWLTPEHYRLAFMSCEETEVSLVKFCCAVAEYERTADRKRRKERGLEVCQKFSQRQEIADVISPAYLDAMRKGIKFERVLLDARMECVQILAQNNDLVCAGRKSQALRAKTTRAVVAANSSSYSMSTNSRSSFIQINASALLESVFFTLERSRALTKALNARSTAPPTIWPKLNKIRFCEQVSEYFRAPDEMKRRMLVFEFVDEGKLFEEPVKLLGEKGEEEEALEFDLMLTRAFDKAIADLASDDEVMEVVSEIMVVQ